MAEGMLAARPAEIRSQVRDWLTPLVSGVTLDEPQDWSEWDEHLRR
jgi:hypothetical protein